MAADDTAVEDKALGAEIGIVLREIAHQAQAQSGHVARRCDLVGIGQARGIGEGGAAHADGAGGPRHALGKGGFAAAEIFGHGSGNIVGGLHHKGADGGLDSEGLARLHAKLGGWHGGGAGRHADGGVEPDLAGFEVLKQHIERHHFGERGGMTGRIGALGIEQLAVPGINRNGSKFCACLCDRCEGAEQDRRYDQQYPRTPSRCRRSRSCRIPPQTQKLHTHSTV